VIAGSRVAPERAFERAVLIYSPVWMAAVAVVMRSGMLAHWRDPEHLLFGLGLALPVLLMPFTIGDVEHRSPVHQRYAARAVLYVLVTTVVQVLLGSWLFFQALGMEYRFHTRWVWNGSPVFLYPMTLAYFATYFVLLQLGARALALPETGARRWLTLAVLSYAVAFAETLVMATPILAEFFGYRDKRFMLLYGSFCYGTVFFATLPGFLRLSAPRSLGRVALEALFANAVVLALYGAYARVLPQLPRP